MKKLDITANCIKCMEHFANAEQHQIRAIESMVKTDEHLDNVKQLIK